MDYSPHQNDFDLSLSNKNDSFDYLKSKKLIRGDPARKVINKTEIIESRVKESPHFANPNKIPTAVSNLGIYQNKTFYSVNQPKRAGTSFSNYPDDAKRKRAIKKFRGKINITNSSNSAAAAFHPQRQTKMLDTSILNSTGGIKSSVKGNEKIFLPINEVVNQARKDQISNTHTLSDILKNLSSTRKNKPSILENISNNRELVDLNRSRGGELVNNINQQSLTQDEINDIKKNISLMNIQKSVLGSAGGDKREQRHNDTFTAEDIINSSSGKKSSLS